MPKKLSFSTNAFKKNTLEEAVEIIANAGYEGVEIMADVPHAYPLHMDGRRIDVLRALLDKNGLAVANMNAFTFFGEGDTYHPSWLEPDGNLREKRIRHTLDCIELAAALNCPGISLEPGGPLPEGMSYEEGLDLFCDGLRAVLPSARDKNIKLLVEPEPGLLLDRPEHIRDLLARSNDPLIGINCDVGHMYCVGADPVEVVREFAEHIGHFHFEDIAASREHFHLPPGKGAIDFAPILAAIDEIKYDGFITVELYPFEDNAAEVAEDARRFFGPYFQAAK